MSLGLFTAVAAVCAEIALAGSAAAAVQEVSQASDKSTQPVSIEKIEAVETPQENAADSAEQASSGVLVDDDVAPPADPFLEDAQLAFAGLSDEGVVDAVLSYVESIGTLKGDFTQISPSGAIAEGVFHLRRPNQLRFDYDPPTPLLIVATQGNVYVRDEDLETTDFYPIKKTPLRFLLSKKVDLDDARVVAVDRGVDTVAVTFASDDEETEGELSVILNAPDLSLDQWIVRDLQGGITIVSLKNVVAGEKFSNRLFRAPEAGGAFLKN